MVKAADALNMSLDNLIKTERSERKKKSGAKKQPQQKKASAKKKGGGRGKGRGRGRGKGRGRGRGGRSSSRRSNLQEWDAPTNTIGKRRSAKKGGRGRGRGRGRGGRNKSQLVAARPRNGSTKKSNAGRRRKQQPQPNRKAKKQRQQQAEPAPQARGPGIRTTSAIKVSNLHPQVTSDDVREIFSKIGVVTQAYINFNKQGDSTCTAEVVYARKADARVAVSQFHMLKVDGTPMHVRMANQPISAPSQGGRGGGRGRGRKRRRGRGGGRGQTRAQAMDLDEWE